MDTTAYERVHERAGFYDMTRAAGRLIGKGKDVLDLLHRLSTNDLRPLMEKQGLGTQTVLTNEKGRIIDLVGLISRSDDTLMTVSAGHEQQVIAWLDKYTIMEDAKFINATETLHQFGLFGPRSFDLVRQFTDIDLITLPTLSTIETTIAGFPVLIQKFVRLAESGWLVFVSSDVAGDVKQFLEAEVLALGGAVLDDATFDVIRIESGMPVAPNELNDKHNPLESTLVSAVSFTKGCYIGQEVIARLDSYDKVQRHMLGIVVNGVAADVLAEVTEANQLQKATDPNVRVAFELYPREGEATGGWSALGDVKAIGEMTSYAISPAMNRFVGLAYIRTAHATPGNKLLMKVKPEVLLPVQVVKLPFDV